MEVKLVPIEEVLIHPEVPNVRSKVRKDDCADLMKSIREQGVKNPLSGFELNGKIYLVSGERRLSSVRWLHEEEPKNDRFQVVPMIVEGYGNGTKPEEALKGIFTNALVLNMTENIQRQDLNPYDLAKGVKRLVDLGLSKTDVGLKIGKSIVWVNETLKFLEADPVLHEQVQNRTLTLDEAKKLARLPQERQVAVAQEIAQAAGDKKKRRSIKKQASGETRVRSTAPLGKKEVVRERNKALAVIGAMKDKGEGKSDAFIAVSGFIRGLSFAIGELEDSGMDKQVSKYKLNLDERGCKVVEEEQTSAGKGKKNTKDAGETSDE
jgi:ParB family chromosome partitioning protein